MTCTTFPSTGLVPNVTTHVVGNVTYKWTGEVWEAITAPLSANQITWKGGKTIGYSLDDNEAFKQALLAESGKVDNGLPDTAIASQRLDAMHAIFDGYATIADLASGKFKVGKLVCVKERANELFVVVSGGIADGGRILDAGDGNTAVYTTLFADLSTALGGVNNAATNSKALKIPLGAHAVTTIQMDGNLQSLSGVSGSFYDDVSTKLIFVGDGIKLAASKSINNATIKKLKLVGNGTGVGISKTGSATSVTDSTIENQRIENFAVGMSFTYLWSVLLNSIRIINCTKSFELLSQTNNVVFNNFNATGGTEPSRFVNVEGCVMNAANISNQSGLFAFTMSQSYIVMNTPYFENIANSLCLLGSSGEENPSSLIINGGLISKDIVIGGAGCSLTIDGTRQTSDESTKITQNNTVPTSWVKLNVNFQYVGGRKSSVKPIPILDINHDKTHLFTGSSGGSVRFVELYPDYFIMRQTADLNGIVITSSLTIGKQYTLVLMCRKDLISGNLSMKSGSVSIDVGDSTIPPSTDDWVMRTIPFVPVSSDLRLLYKGDLQIKRIAIYEGILNTSEAKESIPKIYYNSSAPNLGVWPVGTIVKNSAPAIGQPKGWVCTASPLTFVSEGVL